MFDTRTNYQNNQSCKKLLSITAAAAIASVAAGMVIVAFLVSTVRRVRHKRVRYLTVRQGTRAVSSASQRSRDCSSSIDAEVPGQAQRQLQLAKADVAATFDAATVGDARMSSFEQNDDNLSDDHNVTIAVQGKLHKLALHGADV